MFTFPFGIKTKQNHKKTVIKCKIHDPFDKQLQLFNESNNIPKRTSRDKKKGKKNKTSKH